MRQHPVLVLGFGLACAAGVSACGVQALHAARPHANLSAVPATPAAAAATATPAPSCRTGSGFELSLVSDRGGQPTPVKAAYWFAHHGGVAAIPVTGWWQVSRDGSSAVVKSGTVTLQVIEGPDRTWQVDGGEWCS